MSEKASQLPLDRRLGADNNSDNAHESAQSTERSQDLSLLGQDPETTLKQIKRLNDGANQQENAPRITIVGQQAPRIAALERREHEQIPLSAALTSAGSMTLNQTIATLHALRKEIIESELPNGWRNLGSSTGANNPFLNVDGLFRPDKQTKDQFFVSSPLEPKQETDKLPIANGTSYGSKVPSNSLELDSWTLQGGRIKRDPSAQQIEDYVVDMIASPEHKQEFARLREIQRLHREDPLMRNPQSLNLRLKPPEDQLTPEQSTIFKQHVLLQKRLQGLDRVEEQFTKLQKEYDRNDWHQDSHWFGLDAGKFLADVRSRNPRNVSDYDKFRVLGTIDKFRAENPDVFAQDVNNLNQNQREWRQDIEAQEHETRRQIVARMEHEVTKLDIALVNAQVRQGVISGPADLIISHAGTSGGWGGIIMDSDATSRATRQNLDKAQHSTERLLELADFSGPNSEFAKAYRERTDDLRDSLLAANANLNKLVAAHQGRVEGISNLAQVLAAGATTFVCFAAAPETGTASIASIPVLVPIAAGATAKVMTKLLENQTAATARPYTVPDMAVDGALAAIASSPLMPGRKLAAPLLQQGVVQAGAEQIVVPSLWQAAKTAATHSLGHSVTGAVDGAIVSGADAIVTGRDPVQAAKEGAIGGAIFAPIFNPVANNLFKGAKAAYQKLHSETPINAPKIVESAVISSESTNPIKSAPQSGGTAMSAEPPTPTKVSTDITKAGTKSNGHNEVNKPIQDRLGVHHANGVGGNRGDNNPLPAIAATKAVDAAKELTDEVRGAMRNYIDRGPKGSDAVMKALAMNQETRTRLGIDDAFIRGDAPESVSARLKLAAGESVQTKQIENADVTLAQPKNKAVDNASTHADLVVGKLEKYLDPDLTTAADLHEIYHNDTPANRALVKQMEWLAAAIEQFPGNKDIQGLIDNFPHIPLQTAAYMAGVREKIPAGPFVVLVHGTNGKFAETVVTDGPGALRNDLFVGNKMNVGRAYSVSGENRMDPAVIGIAVPKADYEALQKSGHFHSTEQDLYLINGDIYLTKDVRSRFGSNSLAEYSGSRIGEEFKFTKEAYEQLKRSAFVFHVDKTLP